ncbi:MAG: UDPGP type 1 family protein [Planctomycetota bacterium]
MAGGEESRIRALLAQRGQEHLLEGVDQLGEVAGRDFYQELFDLNWELLENLKSLLAADSGGSTTSLEPAAAKTKGGDEKEDRDAREQGEALLRAGKVAVFVVAGGQGSRLGFDGPKGMYPATPLRKKSLFQVFAEKVAALGTRYGRTPLWYVMTSRANDEETRAFFAKESYFGLDSGRVKFFSQAMLPALDRKGRILLQGPGELFLSPNGHGGSLLGLRESGALDEMRDEGVEQIFYFQVDNPLVQIGDPEFLGHHVLEGAEMSTKVVSKRNPQEKVGVVGLVNGRYGVIEYSDLSSEELEATTESGQLKFNAGNIAVHAIRRDFVESITEHGLDLPYHLARKQIPALDPETGEPSRIDGVKFETFVFDALARCQKSVLLAVNRDEEFAPIKNAEGEDSPQSSFAAQQALFASWLEAAGLIIPRAADGTPSIGIEISPACAIEASDLTADFVDGLSTDQDLYLD